MDIKKVALQMNRTQRGGLRVYVDRRTLDRKANLQAFVAAARDSQTLTTDWESNTWDITERCATSLKGSKAKNRYRLKFCRYQPPTQQQNDPDPMSETYSDFLKALISHRFTRREQSFSNQNSMLIVGRHLFESLHARALDINAIDRRILDETAQSIQKKYAKTTAYHLHGLLEELADTLDENRLTLVSLRYRYKQKKRPHISDGRINARLDSPGTEDYYFSKRASLKIIEALGLLYKMIPASAHMDRLLLCCVMLHALLGRRIGETLLLPHQNIVRESNGDAYLVIHSEKKSSGPEAFKLDRIYLIPQTISFITDLIREIDSICTPARAVARWIHETGGPDIRTLPADDWLNASQVARFLGCHVRGVATWARTAQVEVERRRGRNYFHRESIVAACKKSLYTRPCLFLPGGASLYCHNMLFVTFFDEFHPGRFTKYYATRPITEQHVSSFLSGNGDSPSVFQRYGLLHLLPQERRNSHSFRHLLCDLLDRGGLSSLFQSQWFFRSNPRDNSAYHTTSPNDRLRQSLVMLEGTQTFGADSGVNMLPARFIEATLLAAQRPIHDLGIGFCAHHWEQSPCPKGEQVFSVEKALFFLPQSKVSVYEELSRQLLLIRGLLDLAHAKARLKIGPAQAWIDHYSTRLSAIKAELLALEGLSSATGE